MRALKILQSAINVDYDFINNFETDEELEEYTLLAIEELEALMQENQNLRIEKQDLIQVLIDAQEKINKMLEK